MGILDAFCTVKQAATVLRRKPSYVRSLVAQEAGRRATKLRGVKISGQWAVEKTSVLEELSEHGKRNTA